MGPGDGPLASLAGWVFSASGQPERGAQLTQFGMRTEPYFADWILTFYVKTLMMLSRVDEAKALAQAQLKRANPTMQWFAHEDLAVIATQNGGIKIAQGHIENARKIIPTASISTFQKYLYYLKDKEFLKSYIDALRTAGLPETPPQ